MIMKNRIAQLREARGMKQEDLAKALHVSAATIANWEKERRDPTPESLLELSALFDVSIDYIMCNKIDPMRGRDWNWSGDNGIGECKTGDFICEGIPHASAIAKALHYMTEEQRDTLLRICSILYPAEFAEILRPRGND